MVSRSLVWESFSNAQILFTLVLMEKSLFLNKWGNHNRCKGPSVYLHSPVIRGERFCWSLLLQSIWKLISSGGDETDKWPLWPMSLVIDHLLEHTEKEGHLRAGETFLWPRIRKSKGFTDLQDPVLGWVAPKNRPYCNDTWMFYSPIYLGMTILIELSNCWGLSRSVEIRGITEKEIPRGSDSWTQCGIQNSQG